MLIDWPNTHRHSLPEQLHSTFNSKIPIPKRPGDRIQRDTTSEIYYFQPERIKNMNSYWFGLGE